MRVVLATSNPGKVTELQKLLEPLQMEVVPQTELGVTSVEETGLSFIENAIIKARHAAQHTGLPAIADDSGIEVDALHGAPGIHSARYAGDGASDADNLNKLLNELRPIAPELRTARYRCALVYMRRALDPAPIVCQASWEGLLIDEPRGSGGFGYDPIFELPSKLTAAELPAAQKNTISHRGRALQMLVNQLREQSTHFG